MISLGRADLVIQGIESFTDREDEQDQDMAQSPVLAHQSTVDTLERLAEKEEAEEKRSGDSNTPNAGTSSSAASALRLSRDTKRNRQSQWYDG